MEEEGLSPFVIMVSRLSTKGHEDRRNFIPFRTCVERDRLPCTRLHLTQRSGERGYHLGHGYYMDGYTTPTYTYPHSSFDTNKFRDSKLKANKTINQVKLVMCVREGGD